MRIVSALGVAVLILACAVSAYAGVEVYERKVLGLEGIPLDVAASADGKRIFVLTGNREVLVYSWSGQLVDRIRVGKDIDGIRPGPKEDVLILTSRKEKRLEVLTLDFIRTINISGAPFKGPEGAPVAIVVFSEFQ